MEFFPILNYETYAISKNGVVKDLRSQKIMKQYPNPTGGGYLQLQLINENGYCAKRIHRLVAETFIENTNNLLEIDHIDRNVLNNHIDNLRWVTKSENQINKIMPNTSGHKYINLEILKSKRNPNPSWRIVINNTMCKYKKRFQYADYTIDDIIKIRNDILTINKIPILD